MDGPARPAQPPVQQAGLRLSTGLLLGVTVAIWLLCAALYSRVIPPFEGFDAQAHYAAVLHYRSERTLPVLTPALVEQSYELVPHPPLYYVLAALAGAPFGADGAAAAAAQSVNAYFDKSLSLRQSVTVPGLPSGALAPAEAARFVAMLGGLITVLCTWWLARRVAPQTPSFAMAAALVAGLNPQFLFTAVTISNDAWAAATAALALAAGVDVTVQRRGPRAWFWVGAAVGVAALTKYSTLAVLLPLAALWAIWLWAIWLWGGRTHTVGARGPAQQPLRSRQDSPRRTSCPHGPMFRWRAALAAAAWAALGFALLAGWWFARNWLLYGEIVPLERMAQVLPTMRRPEPYTWARTFEHIPWLIASFWGVFVAVIAPPRYLEAARWFMAIGFVGVLIGIARFFRTLPGSVPKKAISFPPNHMRFSRTLPGSLPEMATFSPRDLMPLPLLVWLAVVAGSVLYWTRTVEYGEQGRLAHIGASAFGVLMVWGWQAWLPPRLRHWRPALHGALAAGMIALALALLPFLQTQFGLPPAVPQPLAPDRPLDVAFAAPAAGGMRLLGADFPAGAALEPHKPLPVTLYWTTAAPDTPVPADYTLFLHVADAQDRLLYQFDGVPAEGRHPTRQWLPGEVFADTHLITVDEIARDGLATLSLGFYPIADPSTRVTVYDASGEPLGDRLVLAALRLHPTPQSPAAPPAAPVAVWENGITLAAAQVTADARSLPAAVTLTWTPTRTIQSDYTVFVQVLDSQNTILAQADSPPQGGEYPTSTWRAGDVITDTLRWEGDTAGWARIIVGLYGADGSRLPLLGGGDYAGIEVNAER